MRKLARLAAGGVALVAGPAFAAAQQLGGGGSADVSILRVFLALFVCLIIAVLAILFVRQRLGGTIAFLPRLTSAGSGRIRIVETRRISPQAQLSLVHCDGREYLLLMANGGNLLLKEAPAAVAGHGSQ